MNCKCYFPIDTNEEKSCENCIYCDAPVCPADLNSPISED